MFSLWGVVDLTFESVLKSRDYFVSLFIFQFRFWFRTESCDYLFPHSGHLPALRSDQSPHSAVSSPTSSILSLQNFVSTLFLFFYLQNVTLLSLAFLWGLLNVLSLYFGLRWCPASSLCWHQCKSLSLRSVFCTFPQYNSKVFLLQVFFLQFIFLLHFIRFLAIISHSFSLYI